MFAALKTFIYVQISAQQLTVKNLKSGEVITEVPEVAISAPPKPKILAIGPQARAAAAAQATEVINPFGHPRSLVSDFTTAQQVLQHYLRRIQGNAFLFLPVIVMHPLGSPVGGFTQVERRAFREMALGAGASEVVVWTGRSLADQEILSRQYPPGAGTWE